MTKSQLADLHAVMKLAGEIDFDLRQRRIQVYAELWEVTKQHYDESLIAPSTLANGALGAYRLESMGLEPQVRGQPIVLHFGGLLRRMGDDEFLAFCRRHPDYRIERTAEGDLIVMPPTGGETGRRNFMLTVAFGNWAERDGTGIGFDSSTGFHLPNGADRSPDIAWVRRERWEQLPPEQRKSFPPLAPDFVLELRSESDSIEVLREKMEEYIANGVRLGWLIDTTERTVYVYRPGHPVEVLQDPGPVSGDPVLPGFTFDLHRIWEESGRISEE